MCLVVFFLDPAPAGRLAHGALHGAGDGIGIKNHAAVGVSGRAADGLHQGGLGAQKALFIGVQNGHQ